MISPRHRLEREAPGNPTPTHDATRHTRPPPAPSKAHPVIHGGPVSTRLQRRLARTRGLRVRHVDTVTVSALVAAIRPETGFSRPIDGRPAKALPGALEGGARTLAPPPNRTAPAEGPRRGAAGPEARCGALTTKCHDAYSRPPAAALASPPERHASRSSGGLGSRSRLVRRSPGCSPERRLLPAHP